MDGRTRLIKLSFNDCPFPSPPSCEISLRQLTLIYLGCVVKQFDVNFVGDRIRLEIVDRTFPQHRTSSSPWKGRQGFSVNVITLHTWKPGRTILCENAFRGKSSFHRRCLPCDSGSSAYVHTVRALRNSRQRLFFSPTCWRIGSLYFHCRSNWITSFFFPYIVRILFFLSDLYLTFLGKKKRGKWLFHLFSFVSSNGIENCRTSWNSFFGINLRYLNYWDIYFFLEEIDYWICTR